MNSESFVYREKFVSVNTRLCGNPSYLTQRVKELLARDQSRIYYSIESAESNEHLIL